MADEFYPLAPPGTPVDLAKPSLRYRLQVILVLLPLFLFLLIYVALLAGTVCLLSVAIWLPTPESAQLSENWVEYFVIGIRIGLFAFSFALFAFLFKGLLKRGEDETARYLQITEHQHPELFRFIHLLCQEIRCPVPASVYLTHDANAAVFYRTSVVDLVVPSRKNLLLGLALVNDLNLVEFKALLAHEFGHFSQRSLRLSGYALLVSRVVANMVYVRDRWDQWVIRGCGIPGMSVFAVPLYMLVEMTRVVLKWIFRVLGLSELSLRREMEFNADLVAVSVSGSDAPVHVLLKSEFGQACLQQTVKDLALAVEQRLFTRDLFFHQNRTAEFLRLCHKKPELGRVQELPDDPTVPAQVFQPEDTSSAPMWDDHPSPYEREQNAKRRYWRSPRDDRPAWLLFRDQTALREEITRRFYRHALDLEPEELLAEPESVQAFIEDEHSAGTFDPRYQGVYDGRWLEVEDFDLLLRDALSDGPLGPERLVHLLRELYSDNFLSWAGRHRRRREEFAFLHAVSGDERESSRAGFEFRAQRYSASDADDLLATVQAELEEDRLYLRKLDRQVFALHYHVAEHLGKREELCQRYRFHIELQKLLRVLHEGRMQLESVHAFLSSHKELQWEHVHRVVEIWRQVRAVLAAVLRQAGDVYPPPLKHLKAGDSLASSLPAEPSVPDLDPVQFALDIRWEEQLYREMMAVLDKLNRIQIKSLGGILVLQERLISQWGDAVATSPAREAEALDVSSQWADSQEHAPTFDETRSENLKTQSDSATEAIPSLKDNTGVADPVNQNVGKLGSVRCEFCGQTYLTSVADGTCQLCRKKGGLKVVSEQP